MNAIIKFILIFSVLLSVSVILAAIFNPITDTTMVPIVFLLSKINVLSDLFHTDVIFNCIIILWAYIYALSTYLLIRFVLAHLIK